MKNTEHEIIDLLLSGKTLSGLEIVQPEAHIENEARFEIADMQDRFCLELANEDKNYGGQIVLILEALRKNLNNPQHYGTWEPGMFTSDRKPLLINAEADYVDLLEYGMSGDEDYVGFLKGCGLPVETSYLLVLACAGLLLIDDGLTKIDAGKTWQGFARILRANRLSERLAGRWADEWQSRQRKEQASRAGKAAFQSEWGEIKEEVLREWDKGIFKTKAACNNWARKQWPIAHHDTVPGWIRDHEKSKKSAC